MVVAPEDDAQKKIKDRQTAGTEHPVHKIQLPGFIIEKEIGLGDIIKRTTSAFGVKPCGDCEKRASTLNKWLFFGPGKGK